MADDNQGPFNIPWYLKVDADLEAFKTWALDRGLYPSKSDMVRQAVRMLYGFEEWQAIEREER